MSKIYDALQRAQKTQETSLRNQRIHLPRGKRKRLNLFNESFQRLIQVLNGMPASETGRVLLVVSSVPGEGTSTVASSLARNLAQRGEGRVVLVDANQRTPTQHLAFGVQRSDGLSDIAAGKIELEQAIRKDDGDQFGFVSCGRPVEGPAQLLSKTNLSIVFDGLRQRSAWVIVDGPPVTAYSEACVLAEISDGVVLVVQAERTRREVVDQALRLFEQSGAITIGAVLNRRRFYIPRWVYRLA